jgi:hypothetical protein
LEKGNNNFLGEDICTIIIPLGSFELLGYIFLGQTLSEVFESDLQPSDAAHWARL